MSDEEDYDSEEDVDYVPTGKKRFCSEGPAFCSVG